MKSLLDKDFKYKPVAEQGPGYLFERMQDYKARMLREAAAKKDKIAGTIKPKIKGRTNV